VRRVRYIYKSLGLVPLFERFTFERGSNRLEALYRNTFCQVGYFNNEWCRHCLDGPIYFNVNEIDCFKFYGIVFPLDLYVYLALTTLDSCNCGHFAQSETYLIVHFF